MAIWGEVRALFLSLAGIYPGVIGLKLRAEARGFSLSFPVSAFPRSSIGVVVLRTQLGTRFV